MSYAPQKLLALFLAAILASCGKKDEPQAESKADPPKILHSLDADANGLYDDQERKAVLEILQESSPALAGKFDANGDGKVTIEEQTADKHPISLLVSKDILAAEEKVPWCIDLFPEWLMSAYFQEDVTTGPVASHEPRGSIQRVATQEKDNLKPKKSADGGGIEFAENSGQFLAIPSLRDARWHYRWCLFSFRIDANTGSDEETVLLDLNHGITSNTSSPRIWFNKKTGLHIHYLGLNKGGVDKRLLSTNDIVADGKTWNTVVCGIRYGQLRATVNGTELHSKTPQPARYSGEWIKETRTYLGDKSAGNMAWAYDSLIFGLTEPSEAMVRKMSGWAAHRLGDQSLLPEDHPYKASLPIVDEEDFPARYVHDDEKWTEWGSKLKDKEITRVNAGGPRVAPKGFERVFLDDFRAYRISDSASGEGDLWMGPGFNPAVGGTAPLVTPGQKPEVYPHDAGQKKQTISLVQQENKRWRGSAFYSVNDLGHGYTWRGPKIFRIRCQLPKMEQKDLAGGLFPAFWSYDPTSLFWTTGNRIEVDWFEFDGKNGQWLNGLSTHLHYAYLQKNIFAKNPQSYKSHKGYSGMLTEEKSKIPGGFSFWDGEFHTWEFVVDDVLTYANVTIKDEGGKEKWIEIYRTPTAPTFLENLDLQLDYALRGNDGNPKDGQRQDFVIDSVEVFQKSEALAELPSVFESKPTLSGNAKAGREITCNAQLQGISDVRYYWFADDYPLTYGTSNTLKITEAEAGKKIRCMVKAVGALNMPEAWTDTRKDSIN